MTKFHEGQIVRTLRNPTFNNGSPRETYLDVAGVLGTVASATPDSDGDIRVVDSRFPETGDWYISENSVEAADAPEEPQDIPTRIAALRAELEALEAQQEAAEREVVVARAMDMRRAMNAVQGGGINGQPWHVVERGYMALARAYVPAP